MTHNQPTHVMAPSPARLGLSKPQSPSVLPSSATASYANPPPSQPPPTTILNTPKSYSLVAQQKQTTTLLPLLPPHTRALSILHQMAALTTKLFQVSGQKSTWLTSYRGTLPTFLSSQFLSADAASASSTKQVFTHLTSLQTQLFEAISELQEILGLEESKRRIAQDTEFADSAMLTFTKKVKSAEHVLEDISEDYEELRKPAKRFRDASHDADLEFTSVKLKDILSYAHRISYTTFAPTEFLAGQAPLCGALPPAPQEEQMRASQLYQFANLDIGIPPEYDAVEKKVEALMELPPLPPPPPTMPNMLIPQIPTGWRPGMPIELPNDIPIVPTGWKPGDPIPLPPVVEIPTGWKPGDPVVLPKREEVPQMQLKSPVQQTTQEPIQVRYVQLDINPDQDDYSDYSSDEGISDDEE